MDEQTKRWIEAALDPQGKWYGTPLFGGKLRVVPEVVPISDEEETPAERDSAATQGIGRDADGWDEWEPA